MISEARLKKIPEWIRNAMRTLKKLHFPEKLIYIFFSVLVSVWFLIRVIPKPVRATYPCMQVAAPIMSAFVIWLISFSGALFAFKKARQKITEAKYFLAMVFVVAGLGATYVFTAGNTSDVTAAGSSLEIWYKPNEPLGVARGIFPGRVSWVHNPEITTWDGKNGFWWEDKYNNQVEVDKLMKQTLLDLTESKNENQAWDALFQYFNKTKRQQNSGYKPSEKIAIKINNNNTYSHENNNEINANPHLVLSLLRSLVNEAKIPQENITVAEPSRFIPDNIYEKCFSEFPSVHYVDHVGGNGREEAEFVENAIPYSVDNGKVRENLKTGM